MSGRYTKNQYCELKGRNISTSIERRTIFQATYNRERINKRLHTMSLCVVVVVVMKIAFKKLATKKKLEKILKLAFCQCKRCLCF